VRAPAAEAGGQSAGLDVLLDQAEPFVGGAAGIGIGGDAEGVDSVAVEAACWEPVDEVGRPRGVVAEHVGDDVPGRPAIEADR
jgi:hypothetical protein